MLGNISVWQLLILLLVVVLIFGTAKLKNLGKDLGSTVKGFKEAMNEEPKSESKPEALTKSESASGQDAQFSELQNDKSDSKEKS